MKKLLALAVCMVFFAGVSFAARENNNSFSSASKKTVSSRKSSSKAGKIGIGYSKLSADLGNDMSDLDQFSGRYWLNDKMAVEASLGFRAGDGDKGVVVGGKILGSIITVNSLNIYWLAGLNFGSIEPAEIGQSFTVVRLFGGAGIEYYVLPQLSVLTEMGIRFQSASANGNSVNDFGTYADWLPQAGIRYYFN